MSGTYYDGYPTEPIVEGNPYYRCVHCKRSDSEINGRLEKHESWCEYRQDREKRLTARAPTARNELRAAAEEVQEARSRTPWNSEASRAAELRFAQACEPGVLLGLLDEVEGK